MLPRSWILGCFITRCLVVYILINLQWNNLMSYIFAQAFSHLVVWIYHKYGKPVFMSIFCTKSLFSAKVIEFYFTFGIVVSAIDYNCK